MTVFRQRLLGAITMVLAIALANAIGVWAAFRYRDTYGDAPLALAAGVTGMFALVGMLALSQEADGTWRITERVMRTALASAIMATYLALVCMSVFKTGGGTLSDGAKLLLPSFTTTVGVVLVFYFGASAYAETREERRSRPD